MQDKDLGSITETSGIQWGCYNMVQTHSTWLCRQGTGRFFTRPSNKKVRGASTTAVQCK